MKFVGLATHAVVLLLVALLGGLCPAQSPLPDIFDPGANNFVSTVAVQADGKILVGGQFSMMGGEERRYLARLHEDGSLDAGFNPGANGIVRSLVIQEDGMIVVGGQFTMLAGQERDHIGRLHPDGSLDAGFDPGADHTVYAMLAQSDGKIVVGGRFRELGGGDRGRIGRLHPDGTLDLTFEDPKASNTVYCLSLQPDGAILAGGIFTRLGGQTRRNIGRLHSSGAVDSTFHPDANGPVFCLAVQPDGRIVVGGLFSSLGGQVRNNIGRLETSGAVDTAFDPGANLFVYALALQTDGKILVGGTFSQLAGESRDRIGRLMSDGALDPDFTTEARGGVSSLAVQGDGKILLAGGFTELAGQDLSHLARLNNTEPATQELLIEPSTITWLRGGTSPEVYSVGFEGSNDGASWTHLGQGIRIDGGWQLSGVPAEEHAYIRARGLQAERSSAWFVETEVLVFTSAEAVQRLIELVDESEIGRKRPLLATLRAALASIERGNCHSARGQLNAFRNKVRSQLTDSVLATTFIEAATRAINVLECESGIGGTAKIRSIKRKANGLLELRIEGVSGQSCIVEGSSNLVDWEAVGPALRQADGSFQVEGLEVAGERCQFFRVSE